MGSPDTAPFVGLPVRFGKDNGIGKPLFRAGVVAEQGQVQGGVIVHGSTLSSFSACSFSISNPQKQLGSVKVEPVSPLCVRQAFLWVLL